MWIYGYNSVIRFGITTEDEVYPESVFSRKQRHMFLEIDHVTRPVENTTTTTKQATTL